MHVTMDWTFALLTTLVFVFFGAGLVLDYLASDLGFNPADLVTYKEETVDADGNLVTTQREALILNDVQEKLFSSIQDRTNALHESAKLMYDFAKIVLGALIASITQVVTMRYNSNSKKDS